MSKSGWPTEWRPRNETERLTIAPMVCDLCSEQLHSVRSRTAGRCVECRHAWYALNEAERTERTEREAS